MKKVENKWFKKKRVKNCGAKKKSKYLSGGQKISSISIFEEVASELLFGLALKCPWNGTDFFLIMFTNFNRVVYPYDFWQKKCSFRILLGKSWYVFKPLLSDFQWTAEVLDHI